MTFSLPQREQFPRTGDDGGTTWDWGGFKVERGRGIAWDVGGIVGSGIEVELFRAADRSDKRWDR